MDFKNLRKNLEMALVCEIQKFMKKLGNGSSIWNSKNLRKNLEAALVYEFQKFTKKNLEMASVCNMKCDSKIYQKTWERL